MIAAKAQEEAPPDQEVYESDSDNDIYIVSESDEDSAIGITYSMSDAQIGELKQAHVNVDAPDSNDSETKIKVLTI